MVLVVAVLLSAPALALAQRPRPTRAPSTEAFRSCRDQEKVGDARPCWIVWLQKYRATGGEGEVSYAEEHARPPKEAPPPPPTASATAALTQVAAVPGLARLQLTSTPSAVVALDGRPIGTTPRESIEVPPGEHAITFTFQGRTETRSVNAVAGETRAVDVRFEPIPVPTEPSTVNAAGTKPAGPPTAGSGYASGDVLDLCALAPRKNTGKFEKQRVVLFAASEAGQVNDDAEIRGADGARLVREVFSSRFALDRFHNVVLSIPGRKGWERQETLSVADVRTLLKEAGDEGDAEHNARADRERVFAAYSVGCADYLAVPSITSHETKWEDQKVKTKNGEKTVRVLAFKMEAALGIFRREGESFRRIALMTAGAPSFADTMSDLAAASVPEVNVGGVDLLAAAAKAPDLPKYVSAVPDAKCLVGKAATEGVAGLASCGTRGEGTVEQALGSLDERLGTVCRKARSARTPDNERGALAVQCEVRARSFQLARGLQKESRKVDGWKLFGVLTHGASGPSLQLGREEGVKLGYGFEVLDEHNERIAYFKATEIGPGGDGGKNEGTHLRARSGEAPDGARLDEYPQLGLVFTPQASLGLLVWNYGKMRVIGGGSSADYTFPTIVFGGGAMVGYDLSPLLRWTETYARVGAGAFVGSGASTSVSLVPIDLWFEKGLYLARRLTLAAALGGTVQVSSATFKAVPPAVPADLHLTSTMYGPAGRLGIDVMLHPDWSLRAEGAARVPLNTASYTESDGKVLPPEFQLRSDHFATIGANLGLAKTF